MPVLDAKALETDPEGTAFLLSVLRQQKPAYLSTRNVERDIQVQLRWLRRRARVLQADPLGL